MGLLRRLRQPAPRDPRFRELELPDLLPAAFPDVKFVRVNRANRLRQAASLWKAVQTATWRKDGSEPGRRARGRRLAPDRIPEEHRPQLRFHYRAIEHLLGNILLEEALWDSFFELSGIKPLVINYERFTRNPSTRPRGSSSTSALERPEDWSFKPEMKTQSDEINDDWVKRYAELRIGRQPWAAPAVAAPR